MKLILRPESKVVIRGVSQPALVRIAPKTEAVTIVQSAAPVGIGGSGSGAKLTWTPPSTQQVWMIPHNLGFKPQVTILDPEGNVVYGNVQHLDSNTLSISFTLPFYGTAELG